MARRRSPVRVRERALNPRKAGVFVASTELMEHLDRTEGADEGKNSLELA
jgi:hypothetical protein